MATKNSKGSRLFRSMLLSYLLVLVLPMVISAGFYLSTASEVNKLLEAADDVILKQVAGTMDGYLTDVYSSSYYLLTSPYAQAVKAKKTYNERDITALMELKKQAQQSLTTNSLIRSVYFYFGSADAFLCSEGLFYGERVQYICSADLLMDYSALKEWMTLSPLRTQQILEGESGERVILLLQKSKNKVNQVSVAVKLDSGALLSALSTFSEQGDVSVWVTDGQGVVVAPEGERAQEESTLLGRLLRLTVAPRVASSAVTDWQYTVVASDRLTAPLMRLLRVMLVYFCLCLVVGVALAFALTRRYYSPLQRLAGSMLEYMGASARSDEYGTIEHGLKHMMEKLRDSDEALVRYSAVRRSECLCALLRGGTAQSGAADRLAGFGVSFVSDRFALALYSMEAISHNFGSEADDPSPLKVYDAIVASVVEGCTAPGFKPFSFHINDLIGCLINLPAEPSQDEDATLDEILKKPVAYLAERFGMSMLAARSDAHVGLEALPEALDEATEALRTLNLRGCTSGCLAYREIGEGGDRSGLELSTLLDMKQRFLNFMRCGEYARAQELYARILDECFQRAGMPFSEAGMLVGSMGGTLLMALRETCAGTPAEAKAAQELPRIQTPDALRACAKRIFASLADIAQPQKKPATDERDRAILEYIQSNYTSEELNSNSLSERFGLNSSYLSQIMRRMTGRTTLDYIHYLRLEEAKRLLNDTARTVKEIAQAVGYGNSLNMLRAFRRYEGVTPNEYRGQ